MVTVTVSADTAERTVAAVPIAVRGATADRAAVPATAAVTVQGASGVVQALTPADILLFVDALDGPGVARADGSRRVVAALRGALDHAADGAAERARRRSDDGARDRSRR